MLHGRIVDLTVCSGSSWTASSTALWCDRGQLERENGSLDLLTAVERERLEMLVGRQLCAKTEQ